MLHLCDKLGWELPKLPSANGAQLDVPRANMRKRSSEAFAKEPKRVGNR